jgi:hypothetical protein
VRVADGPPQRIRDKGQQHLPGDEAWLIGEHRMLGEKKYYLANLPAKTDLRKKESTGRRRDRHCPPCARPSLNSSLDHRRSDARAPENGFAAKSSVNKSAKVVLVYTESLKS